MSEIPPDSRPARPGTSLARARETAVVSQWCTAHGFAPVPAAPDVVGAYLANAAHGAIQGPLQGLLRRHGRRPPQKAAALSLALLRKLLATCDGTARGRRDRALLLFGFAGALRRSELVALHVEDVRVDADGLRLRIRRGKTDPEGQGAEIGLPRGRHAETCPLLAFEAWQAVALRNAGPLFRKVSTRGRIGGAALHPDAVRRILSHRLAMAGLTPDEAGQGFDRLSAHALRVGFITEAYAKGVRDEDMISESPAGMLDL